MSLSGLPGHLQPYAQAFALASAETGLPALLVAAVVDRESFRRDGTCALNPPTPYGLGDNGHGHGLGQIDDRSWGMWLASNRWWDPLVNVCKAAEILNASLAHFEGTFDSLFLAVASYNCGRGNVHACLKSLPATATDDEKRAAVDRRTTGGNYAADVLRRYQSFLTQQETTA